MDLRAADGVALRFHAYIEHLSEAMGHADRHAPLAEYCTGLLLPGERKSVEPMAARVAPAEVGAKHQSLHHFVAKAPWEETKLLASVRSYVLPILEKMAPIRAWIVDDTGIPKKGHHSVGVARQYCGELGKQDNCQVAVTLSVANDHASLPLACRLYLPEAWTEDEARRKKAGVPDAIAFATKPQIALDQIGQAIEDGVPKGIVLADAGYGNDSGFRSGVTELGLTYVVGVQGSTTVWAPGTAPLPAKPWSGRGRRASCCDATARPGRSRSATSPRRCPARPGRPCAGVRAAMAISSGASPPCAYGRLTATTGGQSHGRKNGC
jgi:SRSO17 transposase